MSTAFKERTKKCPSAQSYRFQVLPPQIEKVRLETVLSIPKVRHAQLIGGFRHGHAVEVHLLYQAREKIALCLAERNV